MEPQDNNGSFSAECSGNVSSPDTVMHDIGHYPRPIDYRAFRGPTGAGSEKARPAWEPTPMRWNEALVALAIRRMSFGEGQAFPLREGQQEQALVLERRDRLT